MHARRSTRFLSLKRPGGVCRKNLAKLSAVYLIFYIPYLFIAGSANLVPDDQSNILSIIATLIGILSGVTLLVAANKAVQAEPVGVVKSLVEAKNMP
ncbi:MAG: hypothetical protein JXL82_05305 [Candidatus Omnitrophica bacterium]|nr:hypothetical protein [Candidatus Omnitrophota bacterium]